MGRGGVDVVAQLGEDRRQHGQRAEHRDGDDDHRRHAERREGLAGEEHARHRDDHGRPGDEHRAPGGRSGGLECRFLAPPAARSSRSRFK